MIDLFLLYSFIKRLATPFNEWEAFKQGIIDERGNILRDAKDRRRLEKDRKAFGKFDLLVLKLKRLLEKIPGGKTRLGTYAAALWLIKEGNSEELPRAHTLVEYMENLNNGSLLKEVHANAVSSGQVAGIGYGSDGEPGFTENQMNRYKKKNREASIKRFKDMWRKK